MEWGILEQGSQGLWAFALGLALGLFYDVLWGLRREVPRLTGLWDLIFGLGLFFGNLLLFLYSGRGEFRLFFLPCIGGGMFLWRRWVSPWIRRGIAMIWKVLFLPVTLFCRFLKKIVGKLKFFLKNPFSNRKKSVKIKGQHSINGGESGA